MKTFNEANITNLERAHRNYISLISAIAPGYDPSELYVLKTSKGNWALRIKSTDRTIRILSKNILSDELVADRGLDKID